MDERQREGCQGSAGECKRCPRVWRRLVSGHPRDGKKKNRAGAKNHRNGRLHGRLGALNPQLCGAGPLVLAHIPLRVDAGRLEPARVEALCRERVQRVLRRRLACSPHHAPRLRTRTCGRRRLAAHHPLFLLVALPLTRQPVKIVVRGQNALPRTEAEDGPTNTTSSWLRERRASRGTATT